MATFGDYARRMAQMHFARIVGVSVGCALVDWIFGLATFLGLGTAYLLTRIWESDARRHNRIFAPIFAVLLAFGPVIWMFEVLIGLTGSQLIDRGETSLAPAMGGIVAIIGVCAAAALYNARRSTASAEKDT